MTDDKMIQGLSPIKRELLLLMLQKEKEKQGEGPIPPRSKGSPCPQSHGQRGLWFLDQMEPGNPRYNISFAIAIKGTLNGSLNVGTVRQALDAIADRHEILRTRFDAHDGEPLQWIQETMAAPLHILDVEGATREERRRKAADLLERDRLHAFDLRQAPPWRVAVVPITDEEHYLCFTLHHIIADAWSLGILIREFVALYRAFSEDETAPLPPLPIQYADYSEWQRQWLTGDELDRQAAYWQRRLAGAPPLLNLATDRPRPEILSSRGAVLSFEIDEVAADRCRQVAERERVTRFMLLESVFAVLLSRYSEGDDIVIGCPLANRNRAELEPLIGFFVNTVALRNDLRGNPSFVELLRRTRQAVTGAHAHQDLPFDRVVEILAPKRHASYNPVVQVMFDFKSAPPATPGLPGFEIEPLQTKQETAKFDLILSIDDGASGLAASIEYRLDLFERATIQRMGAHFQILLRELMAAPEKPISECSLLDQDMRKRVLKDWNQTAVAYPEDRGIHGLFSEIAGSAPDAIALDHDGPEGAAEQVSYGALDRESRRLGARLRKQGVRPGTVVGLCLDRGPEMVIGMLGILKAGGTYLPLDPSYPEPRLAFMLKDASASALIAGDSAEPPSAVCPVVSPRGGGGPDEDTPEAWQPLAGNLPAYIIYTSGSTGLPRGVAIPHRAVVRLVRNTNYLSLGPTDRVVQAANPSFDATTFEVWGPLLNGGRMVGVATKVVLSLYKLSALIRAKAVTTMFLTTALFNQLTRETPECFRTLKNLLFGGEAVDPDRVREVLNQGPPRRLLHVYGPTEATTFASWHAVHSVVEGAVTVPIGKPIANTRLYVLDRHGHPLPPEMPGELYIGGPGLAHAYLNLPALTAEKWGPDPFSGLAGDRLYRSGDRVRHGHDGAITFLKRLDNQLKLRGFRIEPGEIEAALRAHPRVSEAVAVAREDAPGQKQLVAYVQWRTQTPTDFKPENSPSEDSEPNLPEWRSFLEKRLPAYMVPTVIVALDRFPLNPNGKIDRAALPAPNDELAEPSSGATSPRTPVEEILVQTFNEMLGRTRTGVDHDFFELGGHSLLATKIVSRIRTLFKIELPVRALFEAPTPAGLAARIEKQLQVGTGLEIPPIVPRKRRRFLPLSFAQQRLWFLNQVEPGNPFYNMPSAVRLKGPLDQNALHRGIGALLARHESLRTRFKAEDDLPVQIIDAQPTPPLFIVDLAELSPSRREAQIRDLTAREERHAFDLERGPLLRIVALKANWLDHSLLITMHHIISDGWSQGILIQELGILYRTYLAGRSSPLPALALQYADFAVWQRRWLQDEVLETQLAFWKEHLGHDVPSLDLPKDHSRPEIQTFRGKTRSFLFPRTLSERLHRLDQREGVTLFMSLLATFEVLLQRYSGQDDVVIGTPIANRNHPEIEPLIGFFVNTLALRLNGAGDPSFRELLGRVRQTTLDAYSHQDLPFEKLVEELQPNRDLSRSPIFDVMFDFVNVDGGTFNLPGLRAESGTMDLTTARYDVTLTLGDTDLGIAGTLNFNTGLFEADTMGRFLDHFRTLAEAFAEDPDSRISKAVMLPAEERYRMVSQWNQTRTALPQEPCIHRLVERHVLKNPDAIAVTGESTGTLTYADLDRRARRLAVRLSALGVGTELTVGIALERGSEALMTMLAVVKAGGIYVPLDPEYPKERLAFIMRDTGMVAVITRTKWLGVLPSFELHFLETLCLDQIPELSTEEANPRPPWDLGANRLAYVIYTSGSTGRPKGVAVTHLAVVRLAIHTNYVAIQRGHRTAQAANLAFDAATFEIWGPLMNGAAVVSLDQDTVLSAPELAARLRQWRIDILFLTTALFNQMIQDSPTALRGMYAILFGGEAVDPGYVARALEFGAPKNLLHVYGPTENTTFSTWHPIREVRPGAVTLPIGQSISNSHAYLLDAHCKPVPIGVSGDLYLGGPGLARGYYNRPHLTARVFVPDPFSKMPGERIYRTGDRGLYRRDGAIVFLGRFDHQVKLRGFRVELGEIETALVRHASVREAAVLVHTNRGEKQLAAYVTPVPGAQLQIPDLRAYLKDRLPAYMVPASFVSLEALPLTPNGKIDRKALPDPWETRELPADSGAEPRSPEEEMLCEIFARVLGMERVGIHDNFFDLGGHSLMATQIISSVNQTLKVEVPLRGLFESPTVAGLAQRIAALRDASVRLEVPPIEPLPPGTEAPLSFAQQRLWFLDQLGVGSIYNMPFFLQLNGSLHVAAMVRGITEIVRRHQALRTGFPENDGIPYQCIHPIEDLAPSLIDLQTVTKKRLSGLVTELLEREAGRLFDLAHGPLIRPMLLRLDPNRHVLMLTMHHIVSDGWSLGIMIRELAVCYQAYAFGGPCPLPELPIQYQDFAYWQRKWLSAAVQDRQIAYWRQQLAGAPHLVRLPYDRSRPPRQTSNGDILGFQLEPSLSQQLIALSRKSKATLFMTLKAAFAVLLSRYCAMDDIVVGTPIANRNHKEIEPLIGFFVNTLVMRSDLSLDATFSEFLARERQTALDAYAHQDVPFEQIVEALQPRRNLSYSPLFQIMFAMQNAPMDRLDIPGIAFDRVENEKIATKFDLSLTMGEMAGTLAGGFEYNTDLLNADTIERMMRHYRSLLEAIAADPDQRLSRLPLLDADEHRTILVTWNQTAAELPSNPLVHAGFLTQARQSPDAIAHIFGDTRLSYRTLHAAADRLAHRLRAMGVGPETPVGLCCRRSLDMLPGILGILLAGGAYLPLDPGLPAKRLAYMVAHAGATTLVVEDECDDLFANRAVSKVRLGARGKAVATVRTPGQGGGVLDGNPAAIFYTSGSTGKPKGVVVPHRGLANRFLWAQRAFGFHASDLFLQTASFGFDISLWEFMAPLLAGGAAVAIPTGTQADTGHLLGMIARQRITAIHLLPSLVLALLQEPDLERATCLRLVFYGGEASGPVLLKQFFQRLDAQLHHFYGPTEASINTTAWNGADHNEIFDVLIGKPIQNTEIFMLDRQARPAPIGVTSELHVGGACLSRGYLHQPDQTAARFIPNPFATNPDACGSRLYKTGDLGRFLANGDLQFYGRADQQIKIRGIRVELGEIEANLAAHPQIKEAVIGTSKSLEGDAKLTAYLTALHHGSGEDKSQSQASDLDEIRILEPFVSNRTLRAHLRKCLPEYMVPHAFAFVNKIPRLTSGKLDQAKLPALEKVSESSTAMRIQPRTPTEEILCDLFSQTLEDRQMGITDNFFERGGHSLLATRLMSRVRKVFGIDLPLRRLFEAPTVEALAAAVDEILGAGRRATEAPILPFARTEDLPLSFAQQRLWFLDRLEPHSAIYNLFTPLKLGGHLDLSALDRGLVALAQRHESLRTVFGERDGNPVQVVQPPPATVARIIHVAGLAPDLQQAWVRQISRHEARRPFDLARGPLFRVYVIQLGQAEQIVLLNMHHIISDAWSMNLFIREMGLLYRTFLAGKASPLRPLAIQYADFAAWQRNWLTGDVLESQLAFWREHLGTRPPVLELPSDRPRRPSLRHPGEMRTFTLEAELTTGVKSLGRGQGVTLYMTLLAAFKALLHRYSGQAAIVVGTPIANRHRPEVEPLIGFFVNTLALRTDIARDLSFRQLLAKVRETTLAAHEHQDLPFEKLVEELRPDRDLSVTPLFQVMFNLENAPTDPLPLPELEPRTAESQVSEAPFELSLSITDSGRKLRGSLNYNTNLFDAETIDRLVWHYRTFLQGAVQRPQRLLAQIPLIDDRERKKLLLEWNQTDEPFPVEQTVCRLFESRVRRGPDLTAVVQETTDRERFLTYGALDRAAERHARCLHALGVTVETRVGIMLERHLDLPTALFAVFKAGGAYVPLDPDHPSERLRFVAGDAGIQLIMTHRRFAQNWKNDARHCYRMDERVSNPKPSPHPGQKSPRPEQLAYVIYTSGSTGRPKGVMVQHDALANYILDTNSRFQLGPGDRIPQLAALSFDVTVEEIFPTLTSGATLFLPQRRRALSSVDLLQKTMAKVWTGFELPTHQWSEWVADMVRAKKKPPGTLRYVAVGTERISPERLSAWQTFGIPLYHVFGITEVTVTSLTHTFRGTAEAFLPEAVLPETLPPGFNLPVGRPIANTRVYVLDEHLQPTPTGIPGEIFLGGAGLARGYRRRPDLTASRFLANPFHGAGQRLYRSGDRVKYLPNGDLVFLGRLDEQVKIRGFRIEPGEIEAALGEHPSVNQALVQVHHDPAGDPRLAAYVTPRKGRARSELWPSHGEYPVYDDALYRAMARDDIRNACYREAIRRAVPGKVVLDLGTGGEAVWARFCLQCGARKVYAIEMSQRAYQRAQTRIQELGLKDQITLIHGVSTEVRLPEKVDVCVSELIGTVGSSEGAVPFLNDARKRLLKPGGVMIPRRCLTRIAAVRLPDTLHGKLGFGPVAAHYVRQIFDAAGRSFDLRVCLKLPVDHLITGAGVFEDLDFSGPMDPAFHRELKLTIHQHSRFDGFLLWVNLYPGEDEFVDVLADETSWLPLYLPIFHPGLAVKEGDRLRVSCDASPSADGIHQDYRVKGMLIKVSGETIAFDGWSRHDETSFKGSPFYRALFADGIPELKAEPETRSLASELRNHLKTRLPDYMLPASFITLARMPLTPTGKLDRRGLPKPERFEPGRTAAHESPRNPLQVGLKRIWEAVLNVADIGILDNFFDLGGHSLLAVRLVARIRKELGLDLPLAALFQAPTIEQQAAWLTSRGTGVEVPALVKLQTGGDRLPFFAIHPVNGFVFCYTALARGLDPNQPFYGLTSPLLREEGREFRLQDLARFHADAVMEAHPGPYRLGGWSLGGVIAYETARVLLERGREVSLLALFDSHANFSGRTPQHIAEHVALASFGLDLGAFPFEDFAETAKTLARLNPKQGLAWLHRRCQAGPSPAAEIEFAQWERMWHVFRVHLQAHQAYVPPPFAGRVAFFQAKESLGPARQAKPLNMWRGIWKKDRGTGQDPSLEWKRLAAELEVIPVEGNHFNMLQEPWVKGLAMNLDQQLAPLPIEV